MQNTGKRYSVIRDAKFVSIIIFLLGFILILVSYLTQAKPGEFLRDIPKDFGSVLCSIGVVSLVYELLIRRQLINDYHDELSSILNPDARALGLNAIFANRSEKMRRGYLLEPLIRSAQNELICVGLSLYQVLEHRDLIRRKAIAGCAFHFVIFDFNCDSLVILDRSLGRGYGRLPTYIGDPTYRFQELLSEISALGIPEDRFSVRLYDFVPTFGMIALDRNQAVGRIIVELNGVGVEGAVCPGFELVRISDGWFDFFSSQIDLFIGLGRSLQPLSDR